jgi:hypothetical protein
MALDDWMNDAGAGVDTQLPNLPGISSTAQAPGQAPAGHAAKVQTAAGAAPAAPAAAPQDSASQVIDSLGVAKTGGIDPNSEGANGGITGGSALLAARDELAQATDPTSYAAAQDKLARTTATTLTAAGHQVSWNGSQLVVDGRTYNVGGAAPEGFDAAKWTSPDATSDKYTMGRILAGGGSLQDAAAAVGGTVLSDDKIQLRDGHVIDFYKDTEGAHTLQFVDITGSNDAAAAGATGGATPGGGTPTGPKATYTPTDTSALWDKLKTMSATPAYTPTPIATTDPRVEALANQLAAAPVPYTADVVNQMKAADAEEQIQAAQSADEASKRFGFQAGLIDSPWLASERSATARDYDRNIIANRRAIDMKAAETNTTALQTSIGVLTNVWNTTKDAAKFNESMNLEAGKLGLSKDEFIVQLQERLTELEQGDRQFTATFNQNDQQFGANLGLNYDRLNNDAYNSYWG